MVNMKDPGREHHTHSYPNDHNDEVFGCVKETKYRKSIKAYKSIRVILTMDKTFIHLFFVMLFTGKIKVIQTDENTIIFFVVDMLWYNCKR